MIKDPRCGNSPLQLFSLDLVKSVYEEKKTQKANDQHPSRNYSPSKVNQDNRIVSNQKGWGRKESPKDKLQKQTAEDETMRTHAIRFRRINELTSLM